MMTQVKIIRYKESKSKVHSQVSRGLEVLPFFWSSGGILKLMLFLEIFSKNFERILLVVRCVLSFPKYFR